MSLLSGNWKQILSEDLFLEITMFLGQKLRNCRQIPSEDFFFALI